jgi:hypothetical protein
MTTATDPSDRTARVLGPGFTEGLDALSTDDVRRRRDTAVAERDFQSYLRRLIQTRQDYLRAEQARREEGAEAAPLVERLTAVLSAGPHGGSRGEALRIQLPEEDIADAEARIGQLVGDLRVDEPGSLTDDELARLLASLVEAERAVSADRSAVFRVHDALQDELKRRYREDPAEIPSRV